MAGFVERCFQHSKRLEKLCSVLACRGDCQSVVTCGNRVCVWCLHVTKAQNEQNANCSTVEPKAYCVLPQVWAIGTIIGPAIGGTFSDPVKSFPNTFAADGLFGRYPYLLPNLICAGLLSVSIVGGFLFLEETHPDFMPRVLLPDTTYFSEESPLIATVDALKKPTVDLRAESYGTFSDEDASESKLHTPKFLTKRIMALIVAIGLFTYHSMTFDHLLPIFLEDDRRGFSAMSPRLGLDPFHSPGGLGLTIQQVGVIMSSDGLIALFIQAFIFPFAAAKFGVHRLFTLVTLLHPITYLIMPYLIFLPSSCLYPGIYFCLAIRNILSIIAYPVLLILIKEATPSPTVLGKVNGLTASAGAACRTMAPPIAGYLYTMGKRMDCTALAWWGSAFVAIIGAVQCFSVERPKNLNEKDELPVANSMH